MVEQVDKIWNGADLIPSKGHKMVGEIVYSLLVQVIADKSNLNLHEKWKRNYELRRNKHWRSKPSINVPLITGNLLHVHITKTVSALSRNNPTFNVSRMGEATEENKELFDDYQRTAAFWWVDQEQQHLYRRSITNSEMYGATIEKSLFNKDIEYPLGEAEAIIVDPFHFGFYPVNLADPKDLQKSQAVFYFFPMSVRDIKRRWPETAKNVVPDSEILKELGDDRRELVTGSGLGFNRSLFTTYSNTVMRLINWGTKDTLGEDDQAVVCECWCKDYSIDKEGNYVYPGNIRLVTITNGGNVVLEDKSNPNINLDYLSPEEASKTYLFDKFPFYMVNSADDTSNAWGLSDFEQLEGLIVEYDKCLSQLTLYKDNAARNKAIIPKDSGVRPEDLTNYPSPLEPLTTALASGIRYMEMPKMPIDIKIMLDIYKDLFFTIAQTFELQQAQTPGRNIIAYKAIAALIEQASTMMVGKIESASRLVRERGRMYLSQVQNFYTEDRWITYKDKNGEDVTKVVRGKDLVIPAKLTVVSGSTMPRSEVQKREEAIELAKAGFIDRKALLDALQYEDRNDIGERMDLGILGQLFQKLEIMGVPPEFMKYIEEVSKIDSKMLTSKIKKQELPPFEAIHQQIMQNTGQVQEGQEREDVSLRGELEKANAEVQKIIAEAEKIIADRDLILEKIKTEKVEQQVKLSGVEYDAETIRLNKAKAIKEIEDRDENIKLERVKTISDIETKKSESRGSPPYRERGLKSNNEEIE